MVILKVWEAAMYRVLRSFFLFAAASHAAFATTVVPESPEELADRAPIVVHARVVDIEVNSDSGRRTAILEPVEIVRAPSDLRHERDFRVPLMNRALPRSDVIEKIPGAPELHINEEIVAFLYRLDANGSDSRPAFGLMGFQQGKLRVVQDESNVRRVLTWRDQPERDLTPQELRNLARRNGRRKQDETNVRTPRLREVAPAVTQQGLRTLDAILNRVRSHP